MEIGLQQQQLDLRLRIEDSADFLYFFLFIYFYMSFTARRSLGMATIINFFFTASHGESTAQFHSTRVSLFR